MALIVGSSLRLSTLCAILDPVARRGGLRLTRQETEKGKAEPPNMGGKARR